MLLWFYFVNLWVVALFLLLTRYVYLEDLGLISQDLLETRIIGPSLKEIIRFEIKWWGYSVLCDARTIVGFSLDYSGNAGCH